ncbi:hypothetical protein [Micrococcus luteus]|uniref:hypothetical protein n=1 Tax=Micrococcus luteus TaxID=1270 RepID=UPI00331F5E0A
MTIRTLALASGVTSIQDHRLALGAFLGPGASVLERRGGIYYYPGAADLVSAAALQANVTPFVAVVDGTSNSLQGQVVVVVDANETLTFSAGEAAVARTDRVVLQVRDNTYDASGSTDARVVIVKGNTSTGAANAIPASSILLWEVTVPIGASSITFSSARADKRTWMATPLRIPVNSSTERNALPAIPGLEVTRLDTGDVEQYWSGSWRTSGGGSTAQPSVRVSSSGASMATALTVSFSFEAWDTTNMWDSGSPTRVTIPSSQGGLWAFGGVATWSAPNADVGYTVSVNRNFNVSSSTTTLQASGFWNGNQGSFYRQNFSGLVQMVAGEWFTIGLSHQYSSSVSASAEFWAYRISA